MKTLRHILTATALAAVCTAAQAQVDLTVTPENACTGDTITITVNYDKSKYQIAKVEFGDGIDTYTTGNELKHIYANSGSPTITVLVSEDNAWNPVATKTLTIGETPDLTLEDNPTAALLTATVSSGATLEWSRNGDKVNIAANTLYYYESGTYTVTATVNGCSASQTLKVKYEKETANDDTQIKVVNNVITPGVLDGNNDVLFIEDVDNYPNPCSVKIFDKKGKLVYTNNKYSNTNGFQGLDDDGNELFAGTYYYVIKSQGKKGCTGYVDLIR